MIHYLLLSVITMAIIFLAWRIWKVSKAPGFLAGIALMYYWTLMGAWFLIYDDLTGGKGIEFGLSYYVYTEILFPVHADNDYLITISLYGLFILLIEAVILWFFKRKKIEDSDPEPAISIHHGWLIAGCVVAMMISFSLVWKEILTAAKYNHSIYVVTRQQHGSWHVVHQLLNQVSVSGIFLGLLIYLSGPKAKFITGSSSRRWLWLYMLSVILITGFMLLLGNKKELMTGGILALLFFYANCHNKVRWLQSSLFCLIIVIPFLFNNGIRAYSPTFLTKYFDTSELSFSIKEEVHYTKFSVSSSALAFLFSNEMFCAHMSMYGSIHHHLPFTYGSSLVSLTASIVPSALWPDRPKPVYEHYVKYFNVPEGQGFTIHQATGWYLNFGIIGVILGALVMGSAWAWTFLVSSRHSRYRFWRIFMILSFAGFVSMIPTIIRSGPEGFKALFFEGMMLPALVIFLASVFFIQTRKA